MAKFPRKFIGSTFEQREAALEAEKCGACAGSGYYDHKGSPKCSSCDGSGKKKSNGR